MHAQDFHCAGYELETHESISILARVVKYEKNYSISNISRVLDLTSSLSLSLSLSVIISNIVDY